MKTLNNLELFLITGGLYGASGFIPVSSEGIPLQHFKVIEKNMQLLLNGDIDKNQMYININNANSFNYFHVYMQNLIDANPHTFS